MAVDTRDKRASVLLLEGTGRALPLPDATVATLDRQHIVTYRGIAAAAPAVVVVFVFVGVGGGFVGAKRGFAA